MNYVRNIDRSMYTLETVRVSTDIEGQEPLSVAESTRCLEYLLQGSSVSGGINIAVIFIHSYKAVAS